jgi:hypothetical protein
LVWEIELRHNDIEFLSHESYIVSCWDVELVAFLLPDWNSASVFYYISTSSSLKKSGLVCRSELLFESCSKWSFHLNNLSFVV